MDMVLMDIGECSSYHMDLGEDSDVIMDMDMDMAKESMAHMDRENMVHMVKEKVDIIAEDIMDMECGDGDGDSMDIWVKGLLERREQREHLDLLLDKIA